MTDSLHTVAETSVSSRRFYRWKFFILSPFKFLRIEMSIRLFFPFYVSKNLYTFFISTTCIIIITNRK